MKLDTTPQPRPTLRFCETCGKELVRKRWNNGYFEAPSVFMKRKYCNRKCYTNSKIKDNPSIWGYYDRLQRYRKKDKCERCGTTEKLCNHHIDGDVSNNNFDNIMTLCRGCHNKIHFEMGTHDTRIEKQRKYAKSGI